MFAVKPERRQKVREGLHKLREEDLLADHHIEVYIKLIMAIVLGLPSHLQRGLDLINHSNIKVDQQQHDGDVDELSQNDFPHYLRELACKMDMLLVENQTLNPVDDHMIQNHDEHGRHVRPDGFKNVYHWLILARSVCFNRCHESIGIEPMCQPILISQFIRLFQVLSIGSIIKSLQVFNNHISWLALID